MKKQLLLGSVALIASMGNVHAETQYIKDSWNVGLYTEADSSTASLGLMSSGTQLEVLEQQDGYTQVKTSTGEIGWTKSTYLVDEPTNDIKLKAAQSKIDKLNKKIQMLSDNNASVELATQLETAQADNDKLQGEYTQQQQQIETLQAQVQPGATDNSHLEKMMRLLTIALVTLICGFIMGKRMTEAKVKARFNGMKIW